MQNREFVAHTGVYNGTHITALSTGIGTDNIDIVVNELDALVNIDLETRTPKAKHTSLRIIRMGTCGALQEDIPVDTAYRKCLWRWHGQRVALLRLREHRCRDSLVE